MKYLSYLKRYILFIVLCWLPVFSSFAQEHLRPLGNNPTLNNGLNKHSRIKSTSTTSLSLPFKDDFSGSSPFPDIKNWANDFVFINSTLVDTMPSIGIATFDNFDANGKIYSTNTPASFVADYLTSNPINLISPLDSTSLWLSFYFQPGGKADMPDKGDSLILEYFAPNTKKWNKQWYAFVVNDSLIACRKSIYTNNSDTIQKTKNLKQFYLAMVPVVQSIYRDSNFQFRFKNTSSIESNDVAGKIDGSDFWHIDYVYLDKNRNEKDTVYHDITFYKPMSSMFSNYTSIPGNQYFFGKDQIVNNQIEYTIRNNSDKALSPLKKVIYKKTKYTIPQTPITESFEDWVINPSEFFSINPNFENPFNYSESEKKMEYEIKLYFEHISGEDEWINNDTLKHIQTFDDYMAYDDGSSEFGYGIEGTNGIVAYGFNIYTPDTLTGVKIFFNETLNQVNKNYSFNLAVWDDLNGKPGLCRLKMDTTYKADTLNHFETFSFNTSIIVKSKFYIGWYQTANNFLNVGYDLNTNSQKNLFYNLSGTWKQSGSNNSEVLPGSLMMRPILKTPLSTSAPAIKKNSIIHLYPNPATNFTSINGGTATNPVKKLMVYNTSGQTIKDINNPTIENIDISDISTGIYFIKIVFRDGTNQTLKLLKK